jgi:hypothetical protein
VKRNPSFFAGVTALRVSLLAARRSDTGLTSFMLGFSPDFALLNAGYASSYFR